MTSEEPWAPFAVGCRIVWVVSPHPLQFHFSKPLSAWCIRISRCVPSAFFSLASLETQHGNQANAAVWVSAVTVFSLFYSLQWGHRGSRESGGELICVLQRTDGWMMVHLSLPISRANHDVVGPESWYLPLQDGSYHTDAQLLYCNHPCSVKPPFKWSAIFLCKTILGHSWAETGSRGPAHFCRRYYNLHSTSHGFCVHTFLEILQAAYKPFTSLWFYIIA